MTERFAIYYAPAADDPLWLRAAEWLGRDPASGERYDGPLPGPGRARVAASSASARRYGFHATIKPPMALADRVGRGDLEQALAEFAETAGPAPIGRLRLASLDGFLALVPAEQGEALTGLAARVVEAFEPCRAPLGPAERERRLAGGRLSPRQAELVDRYGYPYVLEQFQFHMTLTDRLPAEDRAEFEMAAAACFGPLTGRDMVLDRLVLFHEPGPGDDFVRLGDFLLRGRGP